MCEILGLGFADAILSFVIFVLNIVYVAWGWFMPNSDEKEDLQFVIQKLQSYLNFVTYSDSIALPLKILLLILLLRRSRRKDDSLHVFSVFPTKTTHILEV